MTNEFILTEPWLAALDTTSRRTYALVEDLSPDQLALQSFDKEWNIGQVLSHLGSGAEIGTGLIERALAGETTGLDREMALPIWQRWDAMTPVEQREAWYESDALYRTALASLMALDPEKLEVLRIPFFAGPVTVSVFAGYRLSEQAVHGWDIAVTLDPASAILEPELSLLWERIDGVASRVRDAAVLERLRPQTIAVTLTDLDETYRLDLASELHLVADQRMASASATGTLAGLGEAVLRIVYGRNRPEDEIEISGAVTLGDYRALFPGF
ncbi:MAG TPA: maleylpyruvate isomerase family mycothiol-dependent enzyme [Acidimicrobiales bacterium]|jgi:uncharacterized protein (TIGR03083 family)|nr:maleylpyruvate isomerase family mycothiol-dependent enzyme [Acidimicrobiales bacterium]